MDVEQHSKKKNAKRFNSAILIFKWSIYAKATLRKRFIAFNKLYCSSQRAGART